MVFLRMQLLIYLSLDVSGERIRKDLTEEEKGVALHLDIAVYDVDTCEPISPSYIEIWCK